MPKLPTDPMTVVSLKVDAFKRLEAAEVHPSATGLVPVRGKNGAGKSSLLESMLAALCGKRAAPDLPIMEGQHGAEVVLDLGEIVVKRTWKRDSGGKAKSKLSVEGGSDGAQFSGPQAVLDNLVGRFADPIAFLEMKGPDQVKTVLGVLGLDKPLRELEEQAERHYEERRDRGREADRASKAALEIAAEVEGLPAPATSGSAEQLAAELAAAKDHNAKHEAAVESRRVLAERGVATAARVKELQEELAKAEAQLVADRSAWEEANTTALSSGPIDTTPIVEALEALEESAKHAARRELATQKQQEALAARAAHEGAETKLQECRDGIAELLGSAEFPIDGMAYDIEAKTITINGIPFGQASQGERLRAAAAVAMAGEPQIRVMFAREGSLLDDESMGILSELATERGFQLWVEVVDSKREGVGIWIEDGHAYEAGE